MKHARFAFLASAVFALPNGAQSVLVVDAFDGPGTDFVELQAAIDAAAEGDLLLIRGGTHSASIDGKSLTLQPSETVGGYSLTGLEIRNLTASQSVSLSSAGVHGCDEQVVLENNQGIVWLENVSVSGGAVITDCASVVLINTRTGLNNFGQNCRDWDFICENSELYLFESQIQGFQDIGYGGDGMPGVVARDGLLSLHGSEILGGNGFESFGFGGPFCDPQTAAAPGVVLLGENPRIQLLDSSVIGGADCFGNESPDVLDNSTDGLITQLPGTARRLRTRTPIRDDANGQVWHQGPPGEFVVLFYSLGFDFPRSFSQVEGLLLTGRPRFRFSLGTTDASGNVFGQFTPGDLGPGVETIPLYLQTLTFGTGSELSLSRPTQLHLIDAAF